MTCIPNDILISFQKQGMVTEDGEILLETISYEKLLSLMNRWWKYSDSCMNKPTILVHEGHTIHCLLKFSSSIFSLI